VHLVRLDGERRQLHLFADSPPRKVKRANLGQGLRGETDTRKNFAAVVARSSTGCQFRGESDSAP
jgi:hypothetical protein